MFLHKRGLYCGECSKYRLDIKYPGVENPKRERICVNCRNDLMAIQAGTRTRLVGQTVVRKESS